MTKSTWVPKKGKYFATKRRVSEVSISISRKGNGDAVVGRIESVRTNGYATYTCLLTGVVRPEKQLSDLVARSYPVSKREAERIANIYRLHPTRRTKWEAREAACDGWGKLTGRTSAAASVQPMRETREARKLRTLRERLSVLIPLLEEWTPYTNGTANGDPDPALTDAMMKVGHIGRLVEEAVEVADAVLATRP